MMMTGKKGSPEDENGSQGKSSQPQDSKQQHEKHTRTHTHSLARSLTHSLTHSLRSDSDIWKWSAVHTGLVSCGSIHIVPPTYG